MFCPNCGKEIKGTDVKYCPFCGYELESKTSDAQEVVDPVDTSKKSPSFDYEEQPKKSSSAGIVLGILSICFSFITIGILGLILGIIGLLNSQGPAGKTLNIIGIVLSLAVFISFLFERLGL